uniref:ATP synthase F0 subunit 8 n=1 Tax=Haemaphysalis kitaokai TaxID=1325868 RepID=UPI001FAFDEDF|nr:ATP synthase F0 subunit 8 [Haemaphysalis kitaokai]UNO53874.1 ATP synthase F0 subunit 8 [Haemaphysalis kitaokai]
MPQLFPMNWILLSTAMMIIIMLTMVMTYFFKIKSNIKINFKNKFDINKMLFKW